MNILYLIISFLLGSGLTTTVIAYLLMHPEKVKIWGSIFWWFLSRFWNKAKYMAIKWEVEGNLNSFIRNLGAKTTTQFPEVSIKWAETDTDDLVYEDDKAILVMRDRKHKNKNLVHAAYFFTSQSLLKRSKKHLSISERTSLDLYATKKMLETQSPAAEEQFMRDYFIPSTEKQEEICKFIKQYIPIDEKGLFFPILIEELSVLGNKLFLENPTEEIVTEVKNLVNFLEKFSLRETGDTTVRQEFVGNHMKCAIRVVASKDTLERGDPVGHQISISRLIDSKFENIYMIGNDNNENKQFMQAIAQNILTKYPKIELERDYSFMGKIILRGESIKIKTYLIHLHNPSAVRYIVSD